MIKLDKEYSINFLDGKNITLVRKYKPSKAGPKRETVREVTEETVGYYATVHGAVMGYRKLMSVQFVKEVDDLDGYVAKVEEMDRRLLKALKAVPDEELGKAANDIDGKVRSKRKDAKDAGKNQDS